MKMINIRMRASRRGKGRNSGEVHISGAEGIYKDSEKQKVVEEYVRRALGHSRGEPDRIVLTIERVSRRPRMVKALHVTTTKCSTSSRGGEIIRHLLVSAGVSAAAVRTAERVLAKGEMRGASLISAVSGRRLEPDKVRGVRVSRLGITDEAEKALSRMLSKEGINTITVKEALVLASKVAACEAVRAEVCISDDPDYTTGYVASRKYGYVRIPRIKRKGSVMGGRVFFLEEDSGVEGAVEFLERLPVLVGEAGRCNGTLSIDEIIGSDM